MNFQPNTLHKRKRVVHGLGSQMAHVLAGHDHILTVPNFNFDWQMGYRWAPDTKRFPAGTRFECVAHFDNSTFNPFNPDPTATVKEGRQTYHEMMYGFYFYTEDDEALNLEIDPKTGHVRKATVGVSKKVREP